MGSKRLRGCQGEGCIDADSECWCDSLEWKKQIICCKVTSPTDSFGSINSFRLDSNRFGSVTKEIDGLLARKQKVLGLVRNLSSYIETKTIKKEPQENQTAFDCIIDVDSIIDLDENDSTPKNAVEINPIGGSSAPSSISPLIIILDDEDLCTGGNLCPQWQMGSSKSSDDPPYSLIKPCFPNTKECASFANPPVIDDIDDSNHMAEDMLFDWDIGFRKSNDDIADSISCDQIVPAEVCTQSARSSVTAVLADTDLTEKAILLPHPEVGARNPADDASDSICSKKLVLATSPTIFYVKDGSSRGEDNIFSPDMEVGSKAPPANSLDEVFADKENAKSQLLAVVDNRPADQLAMMERSGGLEADHKLEDCRDNIDAYCEDAADVLHVNKDIEVCAGAKDDDHEEKVEDSTFKDLGVYVGVDDDEEKEDDVANDDLTNIWNEMAVALECSKVAVTDSFTDIHEADDTEDCDHSFIFKDDIGSVCRVCGLIQKEIKSMIEFQFVKGKKSTKTYKYEGSQATLQGKYPSDGVNMDGFVNTVGSISVHPRHKKLMKAHQVEGFNFLLRNLVTDKPGGCIMAHAPGSGKTFMIICFIQCFMAKYPAARPLIVLPKGILSTWRNEFERWQVENVPLYDFYTSKADSKGSRAQQLEVLNQWATEKSILLLGYQQFASIVCGNDTSTTTQSCRDILLKRPSILILDEGHTPRNEGTDILESLVEVQTPRKVVLSGTLYQNHVKEVFNVLNLVRPEFMNLDSSKVIKRRILSKVKIEGRGNSKKKFTNDDFFEKVEATLLDNEAFNMKVSVIKDLREMTSKVLHYYKGDSLDELPGLVDFTVYLGLSSKQKRKVQELKFKCKFKTKSSGSKIYVHPQLTTLSGDKEGMDEKIDLLLENLEVNEGVKAKFFLNLLKLCESSGEKLLVFTQYILPLKFLVRLTMRVMGYRLEKEIFVITGDSSSDSRNSYMEKFNTSSDARVFFGSIKACGEGICLVGASRVIILDVHLNPSVTRQAIGRAFRPGQVRKVYVYRLIAIESPEEQDHMTCFKKESIARMWFEWNGLMGVNDFEMETIELVKCGDLFLETSRKLNEDVISLCKR